MEERRSRPVWPKGLKDYDYFEDGYFTAWGSTLKMLRTEVKRKQGMPGFRCAGGIAMTGSYYYQSMYRPLFRDPNITDGASSAPSIKQDGETEIVSQDPLQGHKWPYGFKDYDYFEDDYVVVYASTLKSLRIEVVRQQGEQNFRCAGGVAMSNVYYYQAMYRPRFLDPTVKNAALQSDEEIKQSEPPIPLAEQFGEQ